MSLTAQKKNLSVWKSVLLVDFNRQKKIKKLYYTIHDDDLMKTIPGFFDFLLNLEYMRNGILLPKLF